MAAALTSVLFPLNAFYGKNEAKFQNLHFFPENDRKRANDELFDEEYYADLPGGFLKNFGRLFKNDLKIYVYPLQRGPKDELHVVDFHHCDFISDVPAANSKRGGGNR